MSYFTINSFTELSENSYKEQKEKQIVAELKRMPRMEILNIDEETYKESIFEEYYLTPLNIDEKTEEYDKPQEISEQVQARPRKEYYDHIFYHFRIHYNYSGSEDLFRILPQTRLNVYHEISVYKTHKTVSFKLKLDKLDAEKFKKMKQNAFHCSFTNIEQANKFVEIWNTHLNEFISLEFDKLKNKYLEKETFYEQIGVTKNEESDIFFSVPIKKKVFTSPVYKKNKTGQILTPIISVEIYKDIIEILKKVGHSMEQKPSLYHGKNEEGIRDFLLIFLEFRYEGITATGETFNKKGKTDILLKNATDNTNIFIAECKFWKGPKSVNETINQLFGYLTWQDTKSAIIFFVRNKDFTSVVNSMNDETIKHEYFSEVIQKTKTSSSFIFKLPEDKKQEFFLEIMLFHLV